MFVHTHLSRLKAGKCTVLKDFDRSFREILDPAGAILEPMPLQGIHHLIAPGTELDEKKKKFLKEYMNVRAGNTVLCKVKGRYRMAVVMAKEKSVGVDLYTMGDGKGKLLGHIPRHDIYGRVIEKQSNENSGTKGEAGQIREESV